MRQDRAAAPAPDPAELAPGLQRHRLAWLEPRAWDALLRAHGAEASGATPAAPDERGGPVETTDATDATCAGDAGPAVPRAVAAGSGPDAAGVLAVHACLGAWAAHGWPLVVARQDAAAPGRIALGLPAPARWGRRRIALQVATGTVARWGGFPAPEAVVALLPEAAREEGRRLAGALRALGVAAGVYGSHGWQALTGLDYLHAGSDLDLCLPVDGVAQADRVADCLEVAAGGALPRIDGELMLPGGAAIAWREWRRWRVDGMAGTVLVKRLGGVALARGGDWLDAEAGA